MGLLAKTTSFGALFVVRLLFLCTIESPKITISHLLYKPRKDLITMICEAQVKPIREHEKLGPYSKLWTL